MQAVILILIGESSDIYSIELIVQINIVKHSRNQQRKGFGRAIDKVKTNKKIIKTYHYL
jgi:hypothetical protein